MSNDTSTTTLAVSFNQSVGITQLELWIQIIVFYGLFGGLTSVIGNIPIAIGIMRNKKLRTRFFAILHFILVTRVIIGVHYMTLTVHRSLRTLGVVSGNTGRIWCYLIHFNSYYSMTVELVLLVGLVIDRVLAIVAFKYYRHLTYRQAIRHCAIASVITVILKVVPSLITTDDFTSVVPCVNARSPLTAPVSSYFLNTDTSLTVVIVVLYVLLILYVRFWYFPKLREMSNRYGDQSRMDAYTQQTKLLPLLQRTVLIHCGLSLTTRIVAVVAIYIPASVAPRVAAYSGVLHNVDLFFNWLVLLISNKDLRKSAFPCRKNNITIQVTAIQRVGSVGRRNVSIRNR